MTVNGITHRPRLLITAAITLLALLGTAAFYGAAASAQPSVSAPVLPAAELSAAHGSVGGAKPTVVLIHGAFADASGWAAVITRLRDRGYPVLAPANPLRGVASDSAYIASILATIEDP